MLAHIDRSHPGQVDCHDRASLARAIPLATILAALGSKTISEGVVIVQFHRGITAQLEIASPILRILDVQSDLRVGALFVAFCRVALTDNCTVPSAVARNYTVDICGRPLAPTVASVAYGASSRS